MRFTHAVQIASVPCWLSLNENIIHFSDIRWLKRSAQVYSDINSYRELKLALFGYIDSEAATDSYTID